MQIRLFTDSQADIDTLIALNRECYPDEDDSVIPRMLKVARRNPCWLLEDNGIKACLLSEISEGQPYIWSVAVTASYRGRGAATALIKDFEKHYAQSFTSMWLHTRNDNPAQKLYFDLGYRVISVERNIYGPNQHGLVMRKRIV